MTARRRGLGLRFGIVVIALCAVDWHAALASPPVVAVTQKTTGDKKVKRTVKDVVGRSEFHHLRSGKEPDFSGSGSGGSKPEPKKRAERKPERQGCERGDAEASAPTGGGVGAFATILMYILVGGAILAALGAIVWAIIKARESSKDKDEDKDPGDDDLDGDVLMPQSPPGELPSDVYLARAMQLAGAGDYGPAIRQLLLGAMSWIERHGMIRYRDGLTNRDYVRSIWSQAARREKLATIVRELEEVFSARRGSDQHRFQRCLSSYNGGFDVPGPEPERTDGSASSSPSSPNPGGGSA